MADALEELAGRIVDGKTVGFIGAGASIRCGYPLWGPLLDGLCRQAQHVVRDSLQSRTDKDDLRWLAQYYSSALRGKTDLPDAVQGVFNECELQGPGEFHQLIARLPIDHFVTTNYDDLLEDACNLELQRRLKRELEVQEKCATLTGTVDQDFSRYLRGIAENTGHRSVLHLHGALRLRDITLSLSDYGDQYMQEAMPDRIYTIFATSTVVFIGSSLTDQDIMSLILRSNFHGEKKTRHFAFLPSGFEHFDTVLKDNYGIEPIRYDVVTGPDGQRDHSNLDLKLKRLLELVEQRRLLAATHLEETVVDIGRVKGNARPVTSANLDDALVETLKNGIRHTSNGVVTFSHDDKIESAQLLRRIANDYRALPARYRFRRVVFLSPSRVGLFPDHDGPRSVFAAVMGEVTRALGHQSMTATVDARRNISALRQVLSFDPDGDNDKSGQVTLFIMENAQKIYEAASQTEKDLLQEAVTNLPAGSAVMCEFTMPETDPAEPRPWRSRKWQGLWSPIEVPDLPGAEAIQRRIEQLDQQLSDVLRTPSSERDINRRILSVLAILANPASSEELTAMIGMAPFEIEAAAAELAALGLLETDQSPTSGAKGAASPPEGLGRLDLTSPVRWRVLQRVADNYDAREPDTTDDTLINVFEETIEQTFDWAVQTVTSLQDWEHDTRQSKHLNAALPNLLTIFEAAVWQAKLAEAYGHGHKAVASQSQRVRFGTSLAYILFNLGRWHEAVEYMRNLHNLCDSVEAQLAAEVHILRSRMMSFTAQNHEDYDNARELVAVAALNNESSDEDGFPQLGDTARDDVLRCAARTNEGVAVYRMRRLGHADERLAESQRIFRSVYDCVFEDGFASLDSDDDSTDEQLRQTAWWVRAEAAEWLAKSEFGSRSDAIASLPNSPADSALDKELEDLLHIMDRQRHALGLRGDRRRIGHHWTLRGEVLHSYRGPAVARRYFAQALVVAYEFRDRLMEASARLGLARCDNQRRGAEQAAKIFAALDLPEEAHRASGIAQSLPDLDDVPLLRPVDMPHKVLFVGAEQSGKSTALRSVARVFSQWGLDPNKCDILHHIDLRQLLDSREQGPSAASGQSDGTQRSMMVAELHASTTSVIEACTIDPGSDGASHVPLGDLLVVHLVPQLGKNGRKWVTPRGGPAEPPNAFRRWDSVFELNRLAYVGLNSNQPILDFHDEIRRSMIFSYLSTDDLLAETRDLWRPPPLWGEARATATRGYADTPAVG